MRIVAALRGYPPGGRYGALLATHHYLAHAVRRGHEVVVGRTVGRGRGWTIDGVTVASTWSASHVEELASTADVVVSHGGDSRARDMGGGRPHVRFAHGFDASGLDTELCVVNSRSLLAHLERSGQVRCPTIVCRPPVLAGAHRVDQVGREVTLASWTKVKGSRVVWRLAERCPDRRFLAVLAGYGRSDERPRVDNVAVIPTQADMRAVWSRTRVLLMPSAFETWGMAGVEAMCSGIPVVAHPTPGLLESLGDAGTFVDRDDIDGWLDALDRLDDPDEYEAASRRARERADELDPAADLDRFVDALEALP